VGVWECVGAECAKRQVGRRRPAAPQANGSARSEVGLRRPAAPQAKRGKLKAEKMRKKRSYFQLSAFRFQLLL
jgi:hypothetical protein